MILGGNLMFDNQNIAKRIKQARIDMNMTQMNLADAMGVSFQAVSNWERGNSLPDISKLEQLCTALNLTVSELLGMESKAVEKAMSDEPMTIEEIAQVAPMMPPKTVQEKVENQREKKAISLSDLAELAPNLDESFLDQLLLESDITDWDCLDEIAPFVSQTTLDALIERANPKELDVFEDVLCFMSTASVDRLILRCFEAGNLDFAEEAAVFASKSGLDKLADAYIAKESDEDFPDIAPFMSKESLHKLAKYWMDRRDMDKLGKIAVFL